MRFAFIPLLLHGPCSLLRGHGVKAPGGDSGTAGSLRHFVCEDARGACDAAAGARARGT